MSQQNKQETHQKNCTRKNRGLCGCDPSSKSPAWKLTPDEETALSPKHTPTRCHYWPQNGKFIVSETVVGANNEEVLAECVNEIDAETIVRAINSAEVKL